MKNQIIELLDKIENTEILNYIYIIVSDIVKEYKKESENV